jgi:hypothetical protein
MFAKKVKKGYESDATRMIRELLAAEPEIAAEQAAGRSRWWDRRLDRDALRRAQDSCVKQKGYVYQTDV